MEVGNKKAFSEAQVAKILQRAAELQEREGFDGRTPEGSSLSEIERIGAELGIDQRYIATAAHELQNPMVEEAQHGQIRLLGAPEEYTVERFVPGRLTDEVWLTMLGVLNCEFKQSIEGVVQGHVRTWVWKHDLGSVHFSAIQAKEGIRIKLNLHIDGGIIAGLIPTVILGFGGASFLFAADSLRPWLSVLFAVLFAVGLAWTFRRTVAQWWARDQVRTANLMDRLVETASLEPQVAMQPPTAEVSPDQQIRLGQVEG